MEFSLLMISAASWFGMAIGLAFSAVVLAGMAAVMHLAGPYYLLPKWAIKGAEAMATRR